MPSLPLWCLGIFGVCFLLADSNILAYPRDWVKSRSTFFQVLLECYFCLGFWVSLAFLVTLFYTQPFKLEVTPILYLFAGSGGAYTINRVLRYLETRETQIHLELVSQARQDFDLDEDQD